MLPRVLAVSLLALTVGCGSSATVVSTQCLYREAQQESEISGPHLVLIYSDGTVRFATAGTPKHGVSCYAPYAQRITVDNIEN